MRGCRHSGVRMIIPSRSTCQPTRVTCRYVKPQRTMHPPQLMEGEALASRVLELGPCSTKFIGPVVMEVPHFASLRGKEREIIILRSDNGETWREHTIDNSEEIIHDVLQQCFEPEGKWEWSLLESWSITLTVRYRDCPTGGAGWQPCLPLCHLRLPSVLCRRIAHTPGGPCHWTGGRHGVKHRGATGAGRLPTGSPHQEDQSWLTGKPL